MNATIPNPAPVYDQGNMANIIQALELRLQDAERRIPSPSASETFAWWLG